MGVEIAVTGLTKTFGSQTIWRDVTLTLPAGEISVMLGPSGTGKSVFLKTLVGLLKPDAGSIVINGRDLTRLREADLYEVRKALRCPLPGRCPLRLDDPLRQRRLPAARAHEEDRGRDQAHRDREDGPRRPVRCRGQACRARSPAACASAPGWPVPSCSTPRSSSSTSRTPVSTRCARAYINRPLRRPQRADRRDVPHRHPRHQHGPHGAGQHRPALPQAPRDVRAARDAAQARGAGRAAVPQRADDRPDRHVGGEGRRRASPQSPARSLPPLPPIALRLPTSDGKPRRAERPAGGWCRDNGITPPPGSFESRNAGIPGVRVGASLTWPHPSPAPCASPARSSRSRSTCSGPCRSDRSRSRSSSSRRGSSRASRSCRPRSSPSRSARSSPSGSAP